MKVKLKLSADQGTAAGLRSLVAKVNESGIALTAEDVQTCAWLLEAAREISIASASHLRLVDFGTVNVMPERAR